MAMNINPEEFFALPPEEQTKLFKNLIMELSAEEQKILKIMIENERQSRSE